MWLILKSNIESASNLNNMASSCLRRGWFKKSQLKQINLMYPSNNCNFCCVTKRHKMTLTYDYF
jgi:hypothetical protein